MRKAQVYMFGRLAGVLTEDVEGYSFQYDEGYLADNPVRLSVNLANGTPHMDSHTC